MTQAISKQQLLAQVILGYIHEYPERHNQSSWASIKGTVAEAGNNACGTTACVAGYAVLFSNDHRFEFIQMDSNEVTLRPRYISDQGIGTFQGVGAELLGLNSEDAERLFYRTTNEEAKLALGYLARGEEIDWEDVFYGNHE